MEQEQPPTTISKQCQHHLNLIGSESETKPWQEAFYVRHIQQVVKLNIEAMDFKNESGLALAQKLMNFVENWDSETVEVKNLALYEQLQSFKAVYAAGLPGIVTFQYQHASLLNIAQKAYQRLILLEIINYIEKLQSEIPEQDASERNKVNAWIKKQQAKLQFSRLAVLRHHTFSFFNRVFGGMLGWLQGVPYIIKFYGQNILFTASRFPNLKSFSLGIGNAFSLLISLYFGGIFRAIGLLLSPLDILRLISLKLFKPLASAVSVVRFFAAIWLFYQSFMFLGILMAALKWSLLIVTVSATIGVMVGLTQALLHKLGFSTIKLTTDQSLFWPYEYLAVMMNTLVGWSISFAMNEAKPHFERGLKKWEVTWEYRRILYKELKALQEKIDAPEVTAEERKTLLLEEREELFRKFETLKANEHNLWQEGVVDFLNQHFNIDVSSAVVTHIGVDLEEIQNKLHLEPAQTKAATSDFDKQKLIRQLMRLKANQNMAKEHGDEVVELVKTINPVNYVNQYKTVADLPPALRKFAEPPAQIPPQMADGEQEETEARNRQAAGF